MLIKLILLAGAGATGTLARYGCGIVVQRMAGGIFPWHTFFVNMVGCFLFGLVFALSESKTHWHPDTRLYVLIGFMGAFTTFSSFAFETAALARESHYLLAIANVTAQNVLGLACLFAGLALGKA